MTPTEPLPEESTSPTINTETPSTEAPAEAPVLSDAPTAPSDAPIAGEVPATPAAPPPEPKPVLPPQPVPEVPRPPSQHDLSRIAQDFQIRKMQVEAVVKLLDEGNSVPFITRYRKLATGGLPEELIRRIQERVRNLRNLADRKVTILRTLANQHKLTDDLTAAILGSEHPKRLEDLYLPFKPKKKTAAHEAREKGLEPLALAMLNRDEAVAKLDEVLPGMVDAWKQLHEPGDVLNGVKQILAELFAERAEVRGPLRTFLWDTGLLRSVKVETLPEGKGKEFHEYFDFREAIRAVPPHRILAVNRGEREQAVRAFFEVDTSQAVDIAAAELNLHDHPHKEHLLLAVKDSVERLVLPSLEREIRRDLTERAQEQAVGVFAQNLRGLLMQPPLRGKRVLAIDPGLRSGCKLAVLDEQGALLEETVVFPHMPRKELEPAKRKIEQLIRKYAIPVIAIGNGTACRETEQLISDLIAEFKNRALSPQTTVTNEPALVADTPALAEPLPEVAHVEVPAPVVEPLTTTIEMSSPLGLENLSVATLPVGLPAETSVASTDVTAVTESIAAPTATSAPAAPPPPVIDLTGLPDAPENLSYVIVNEAGASDYSSSPIAREEFPQHDNAVRGTISIGRRLQDPIAELVKIDPQHIGVGLYQHDLRPKHLRESLEAVVESCVNHIGVDLNSASIALLRHVSGLNALVAREIVQHRTAKGPFKSREELKALPQVGEARFIQAAGFLKLEGDEPLDRTWIHPEHYTVARTVLAELGFGPKDLLDSARVDVLRNKLNDTDLEAVAKKLDMHPMVLDDLFAALARPGRDPRDELPPPIFKTGILRLEDVKPGMELKGTVLNVVPFGAFVDIGVKESGLVHISQLANRYIKSPYDVVSVGDVVICWVMDVKADEKKISLTMIPPGRERERERERPREEAREMREPRQPRPQRQERRPPPRMERPGGPPPDRPQGEGGRPPRSRRFEPRQRQDQPQEQVAPLPPPRPQKPKPIPKLTDEKKSGKAALNTFGELFAFFKDKEAPPPAPEPPADAPPPPES